MELLCPHCGWRYHTENYIHKSTVPDHNYPLESGERCPGSRRAPRHEQFATEPLWKDEKPEATP